MQSIRYAAAEQLSGLSAAEGELAFTAQRESCVVMAIAAGQEKIEAAVHRGETPR